MVTLGKAEKCKLDSDPDCTEILEDNSKSILLGIIKQLSKDMDLHRVTLPTFVLEPRSMLERITDFMSHPDYLLEANNKTEPVDRFVGIVQYFLSGWHIKPKGVKKPYNPVLGEIFRCRWNYHDGTSGYYISEQTKHHPPESSYYFANPDSGIYIHGHLQPKGKFLGNSAATLMQGESNLILTSHSNEQYDITMPNVYAKGILFGKMVLELGDSCTIRCDANDLGFFSGQYNSVVGNIKKGSTNKVLYEIMGQWSQQIYIKPAGKNGTKTLLFDAAKAVSHPKLIQPQSLQSQVESRKLWGPVTDAILKNDMDTATEEKTKIEDEQRRLAKERQEQGVEWVPHYFAMGNAGRYQFKGHAR
ncbi:Oxysterol-binding protein [Hesseltinella vesiculosa]|uniref:Oxysterol-binding protein n=1 Tax=Hesseltinella vesiculosa TaxID=101127 RepID=A0A1X2GDW4_9FUNG|nr:Oxysterol-binding protein [Hesseltinella vesiculosa]